MNDTELINILKNLKNDPALGGDFDVQKSWSRASEVIGLDEDVKPRSYDFREYLEYGIYSVGKTMYKPVMAGAVAVILIVGGWLSAFSTSLNALPGDSFYQVKLGIEKTQLAIAFSGEQHAKLQVEFANRRLGEMIELTAMSPKTSDLHLAADKLKEQVTDIKAELSQKNASKLAMAVERKANVYATSQQALPEEVQAKVDEIKEILEENKEQAVEVMITAHEESSEEAVLELKTAFDKELLKINFKLLTKEDEENIALAKELQKEGLYRRAFQVLKNIQLSQNKE